MSDIKNEILETFLQLPRTLQGPAGLCFYAITHAPECETGGLTVQKTKNVLQQMLDKSEIRDMLVYEIMAKKLTAFVSEDSSATTNEIRDLTKSLMLVGHMQTFAPKQVIGQEFPTIEHSRNTNLISYPSRSVRLDQNILPREPRP